MLLASVRNLVLHFLLELVYKTEVFALCIICFLIMQRPYITQTPIRPKNSIFAFGILKLVLQLC